MQSNATSRSSMENQGHPIRQNDFYGRGAGEEKLWSYEPQKYVSKGLQICLARARIVGVWLAEDSAKS